MGSQKGAKVVHQRADLVVSVLSIDSPSGRRDKLPLKDWLNAIGYVSLFKKTVVEVATCSKTTKEAPCLWGTMPATLPNRVR